MSTDSNYAPPPSVPPSHSPLPWNDINYGSVAKDVDFHIAELQSNARRRAEKHVRHVHRLRSTSIAWKEAREMEILEDVEIECQMIAKVMETNRPVYDHAGQAEAYAPALRGGSKQPLKHF